jgi:transcriptional regulator with XRE-family HTH domain
MPKRAKKEKRPAAKIDFKPYGAAIKAGRTKQKESRNKAADALFISPRYLANIENKSQHPSVQVFLELVSRYHISVDQILYGNEAADKSTERRQFEILLDELTDAEIKILTATAQAILDARADSEGEN